MRKSKRALWYVLRLSMSVTHPKHVAWAGHFFSLNFANINARFTALDY